jgi:hypothetical protein
MCPACLTTLALIVTSWLSVADLTVLAIRRADRYDDKRNTIPIKKETGS